MQLVCPHCHKTNRAPADRLADGPNCGACGQPLLMGVLSVDGAQVRDLVSGATLPVIVDFWSPWCGPCRVFAPTFEAAAQRHGGKVVFAKLDTQAHQDAGARHNIRSIPTLAVFFKGQELGRVTGALQPAQLDELITNVRTHTGLLQGA